MSMRDHDTFSLPPALLIVTALQTRGMESIVMAHKIRANTETDKTIGAELDRAKENLLRLVDAISRYQAGQAFEEQLFDKKMSA